MKAAMEHARLSDLIAITHGFAFKGVDFASSNDTTLPIVLTPGNFSEDARHIFSSKNTKRFTGDIPEKFLFSKGELTVVMTDLSSKMKILGKPAFVEKENILHNQRIGRVIFKNDKLLDRYLYYFLLSEKAGTNIRKSATGTMVRHTAPNRILSLDIHLPPLDEQKRIVAVLDAAFDGLARARANVEANLQNARELFESELKDVFSNNNENWEGCLLSKATLKIGSGATPRGGAASYKTEGISLIRSLNVHDRDFRYKKLAFIGDEQAEKLSNVEIQAYDVLLNITGASVARCCIAPLEVLPARVNQHVSILRTDTNIINPDFLCYELTSEPFKKLLLKTGEEGGATRQAITKAQLQELTIIFPEALSEQERIVSTLNNTENKVKQLEANYQSKLTDLDELRQSLLQKAFAGELT